MQETASFYDEQQNSKMLAILGKSIKKPSNSRSGQTRRLTAKIRVVCRIIFRRGIRCNKPHCNAMDIHEVIDEKWEKKFWMTPPDLELWSILTKNVQWPSEDGCGPWIAKKKSNFHTFILCTFDGVVTLTVDRFWPKKFSAQVRINLVRGSKNISHFPRHATSRAVTNKHTNKETHKHTNGTDQYTWENRTFSQVTNGTYDFLK